MWRRVASQQARLVREAFAAHRSAGFGGSCPSPRLAATSMMRRSFPGLQMGPSQHAAMLSVMRHFRSTGISLSDKSGGEKPKNNQVAGFHQIDQWKAKEEEQKEEQEEDPFNKGPGAGYLPFPPPFHTINIVMLLFLANIIVYLAMNFTNDNVRDFIIEHFTLSLDNYHRIYPFFTSAMYQEQLIQLAIDCWLLWQFGNTMLGFLGASRMAFFWAMCSLGGGLLHIARHKFELYYGIDPLEVRGRCFGPNPFILGLVAVEGLIFRHLNFIQQPPVPFLVLTAFVMVIDVWRIFTTKPEEHGAPTGGALVAYLFWLLPAKCFGLDKLTAAL
jgi:hypothetical protein